MIIIIRNVIILNLDSWVELNDAPIILTLVWLIILIFLVLVEYNLLLVHAYHSEKARMRLILHINRIFIVSFLVITWIFTEETYIILRLLLFTRFFHCMYCM
ncbi:hypothetical protein C2G38_2065258 [Gigaspora rosea]|uniref:Uncharacterized protein n=1 Tax=Gigaspora rosea TaxID=44941 RepID=A0A397VUK6_9GLOM|nr:hypothetical protein C2G38_2065258 [Gigaspora rosea]